MPHHNRAILKSLAEQDLDPSKAYTVDKKGRLTDPDKPKNATADTSKKKQQPVAESVVDTKLAEVIDKVEQPEPTKHVEKPVIKQKSDFTIPSTAKKVSAAEESNALTKEKKKNKA